MQKCVLAVVLLSLISACDPCTGCGSVTYDPTVELIFVDVNLVLTETNEVVKTETKATEVTIFWEDLGVEIPTTSGKTTFSAPLRNQATTSNYSFGLSDNTYMLGLSYDLFSELDIDHRMLVRASFIEATAHSFDSVAIACLTPDCLDKQTTLTCYY